MTSKLAGTETKPFFTCSCCPKCSRWFEYNNDFDRFLESIVIEISDIQGGRSVTLHTCPNDGATIAVTVDDPDILGSCVYGPCDPNLEI